MKGPEIALVAEDEAEDQRLAPLVKRLSSDTRDLLQQEIALAKLEVTSSVATIARGSVFIVAGGVFLGVGLLVLLVFLILGLGSLLDGRYWLSTLIVGGVLALCGIIGLLVGKRRMAATSLKPDKTIDSVRKTREWAGAEARELKQELTR